MRTNGKGDYFTLSDRGYLVFGGTIAALLLLVLSCSVPEDDVIALASIREATLPEVVWEEFEQLNDEETRIRYLLDKTYYYHESQLQTALTLAEHAELLSTNLGDNLLLARSLYWKAFLLNENDPQSIALRRALADVEISIDIFREQQAQRQLARALNLQANIHYSLYEEQIGEQVSQEAHAALLEVAHEADSLCLDWGDYFRVRAIILLYATGDRDSVAYYYDQAYQAYQDCGKIKDQARVLINKAFLKQSNFTEADSLMELAIALLEKGNYKTARSKAQLDYASMLGWRFSDEEELVYYDRSMKLLRQLLPDTVQGRAEVYYQIGVNHHNHAIIFPETSDEHYDSLFNYYNLTIDYGIEEQNANYLQEVEESVARICDSIGSIRCLPLLERSTEANREIIRQTRLSFREYSNKREQFKASAARERLHRNRIYFVILLAALAIGFFYFYQQSQVRLLKEKLESRMAALRAQMNPHFISNSLNAIDLLVNKGETDQASEYIIDFSRLSRLILDNSIEKRIPLAQEIETLQYYLKLEKLRMREKLSFHFEIDDTLNLESIEIAPMLLQPFIENAILHGIQPKQSPGSIWIRINEADHQQLEIRIKDDGVGREKAKAIKKKSAVDRTSWGMKITEERLQGIKNYQGVNIRYADLYDKDGLACGTEVIVFYPIHYRKN